MALRQHNDNPGLNINFSLCHKQIGISIPSDGLPAIDLSDYQDPLYWYFGWTDVNGGWLIRRQDRISFQTQDATTGHPDLNTAWLERKTLTYS